MKGSILSVLRDLQEEGKKIFLSFILGLITSIIILRLYAWEFFEQVMRSNMSDSLGNQVNIIAQTPFEVLFVQGKIGVFVGILFSVPIVVLILSKKVNGYGNKLSNIPRRAFYVYVTFGIFLFILGLWYSYYVFFPVVLEFLASATVQTSVEPMYSVARWTQFMVLLSLSFGIIAQIPVSVPMLVRYEVISYERVKDSVRFWIVGTLLLGAILSPPEPISQLMWSGPLIGLYMLAIVISKYVDPSKDNEDREKSTQDDYEDSSGEQVSRNNNSGIQELTKESDNDSQIGGYYTEISKIGKMLRKDAILITSVFMISGICVFYSQFSFLTEMAINALEEPIKNADSFNVVALHPVELLMFQAKSSVLIALSITTIVASIRIWPRMRRDSMVNINRTTMLSYIFPPLIIMSGGLIVGFLYITPTMFEILIADANRIGADVAYQVDSFFWIAIYMCLGTSGMLTVYCTVIYLYMRGVSKETFTLYWRHIVLTTLVLSMFITPNSITKSLLLAIPISLSFIMSLVTVKILSLSLHKQ